MTSIEIQSKQAVLLAAIKLLTKYIGCYGEREDKEISIHWGNGIVLRCNGLMIAGGTRDVVKKIAKLATTRVRQI